MNNNNRRSISFLAPTPTSGSENPQVQLHNFREDPTATCQLCDKLILFESKQPFGLLEHCQCSFCFNCISAHQNKTHSKDCPECDLASDRILIWPFWLASPQMKAELLNAQHTCLFTSQTADQASYGQKYKNLIPGPVSDKILIFILAEFFIILIVIYCFKWNLTLIAQMLC